MKNLLFILFTAICLTLMGSITAFAYIDPGTGSLILQAIVGGVLACAVAVRMYWSKIKVMFNKNKGDDDEE